MRQKITIVCVVLVLGVLVVLDVINLEKVIGEVRHWFFRGKGAVQQVGKRPPLRNTHNAHLCRQTLTRIQNAKRKAAFDRGRSVGYVTWEEVIEAMYPENRGRKLSPARYQQLFPRCPEGGTYMLGSLEELARCSVMGNETLDVADDHIIYN